VLKKLVNYEFITQSSMMVPMPSLSRAQLSPLVTSVYLLLAKTKAEKTKLMRTLSPCIFHFI